MKFNNNMDKFVVSTGASTCATLEGESLEYVQTYHDLAETSLLSSVEVSFSQEQVVLVEL